uniref:Uncharacterized protein n=1 Tax=Marseillevirus LCMAC103 TaxID=2506604 RepID=A0A481YWD3_9VIRU|nr:MAG: hypothetical protein LCMAC103_04290 [Marseillevirus LCMAC103]
MEPNVQTLLNVVETYKRTFRDDEYVRAMNALQALNGVCAARKQYKIRVFRATARIDRDAEDGATFRIVPQWEADDFLVDLLDETFEEISDKLEYERHMTQVEVFSDDAAVCSDIKDVNSLLRRVSPRHRTRFDPFGDGYTCGECDNDLRTTQVRHTISTRAFIVSIRLA